MKLPLFMMMLVVICAPAFAQKASTMTIKVYFHNEKLNPEMIDCNKVFPTTRTIAKTSSPATAALNELFKGVTEEEKAKGFWSFDRESTAGIFKSLRISGGAAYLNLTPLVFEKLGNATTSCGSGWWNTIEKTLTQFPSVKKVYYAVNGNTDDYYEWVQVGECPYGRHCRKSNFR